MTARELAAKHRRRLSLVEREMNRQVRGIARGTQEFVDRTITREIYSIPEDVSPTGRPKWRRTNLLAHSEKAHVTDPYTVTVINTAPYAEPRHEAGKPGRRKINPLRVSHWRDELVAAFRSNVLQQWRAAILRALNA